MRRYGMRQVRPRQSLLCAKKKTAYRRSKSNKVKNGKKDHVSKNRCVSSLSVCLSPAEWSFVCPLGGFQAPDLDYGTVTVVVLEGVLSAPVVVNGSYVVLVRR